MTQTVLVVEDNTVTALALMNILRANGFEALAASSVDDARNSVSAARPDLILLDVQLPGEDGYEFTRELKANPATASIPIVITTARSLHIDKVLAFEAGCDEFMSKPIQPRQLSPMLREVLARAEVGGSSEGSNPPAGDRTAQS